jgi:hypothetical protein
VLDRFVEQISLHGSVTLIAVLTQLTLQIHFEVPKFVPMICSFALSPCFAKCQNIRGHEFSALTVHRDGCRHVLGTTKRAQFICTNT